MLSQQQSTRKPTMLEEEAEYAPWSDADARPVVGNDSGKGVNGSRLTTLVSAFALIACALLAAHALFSPSGPGGATASGDANLMVTPSANQGLAMAAPHSDAMVQLEQAHKLVGTALESASKSSTSASVMAKSLADMKQLVQELRGDVENRALAVKAMMGKPHK
eukprot:871990-Pleurochrysis_carterae.AAC.3